MRELSASFLVVCLAMSCLWPGQTLSCDAKVGIVVSQGASSAERIAAVELSHFLGKIYSDTDFEIVRVGVHRTVLPVVWAHHDDGNYVGRPYKTYSDFHARLVDSRAPGYSPPNPGAQLSLGASELRTGDSHLEAYSGQGHPVRRRP